jgi:hypothetical protein
MCHATCRRTLDVPELVPAEGMEGATPAFLGVIDQAKRMTLSELRSPGMLQARGLRIPCTRREKAEIIA